MGRFRYGKEIMAAIMDMSRTEMQDFILTGISEIESAGYVKTAKELRDGYITFVGNISNLTELAFDTEDLLAQLRRK